MTPHSPKRRLGLGAAVAALVTALGARPAAAQNIVNIDATLYGFNPITGAVPLPGDSAVPFSLAPNGLPIQLTLGPGTYSVTNATGLAGANPNFTSWRFNGGSNWTWSYLIADDATDTVVNYGAAGGGVGVVSSSQGASAALPAVQNFSATFTLPAVTRLDFVTSDYYLPDNAGGVSLLIRPLAAPAVPEAPCGALLALGLLPLAALAARRRRPHAG